MKVLIADDHDLVLDTLVAFVSASDDVRTVTAPDYPTAAQKVASEGPFDLVLLDLNMPGMNGLEGLRDALKLQGARHVALLTGNATKSLAQDAMAAGAAGFVPKNLPAKSFVNAIRFMAMGEHYVPVGLLNDGQQERDHPFVKHLSRREYQVLEGLCRGKANKEIARDLELSEPTIKLHMKTLYRKIGASNRTHAALMAKDAGVF